MDGSINEFALPGLKIPGNIFLAPMAGYTDLAMREICINFGASLVYSEMVSCEGIIRENVNTTNLLKRGPAEKYFAVQIFTSSPEAAYDSAVKISAYAPDIVDLNCGCPVPKVIKNGAGAALMRDPGLIFRILDSLKSGLEDSGIAKPVISAKLRSGWDSGEITYLKAAEKAQKAGVAALALHPRTRKQGYSGKALWEHIAELKRNSSVPVIGSGDLFSAADIDSMFRQTGCDAVMIARGAVGNPFIFRVALNELMGPSASPEEKISAALKHLQLAIKYYDERRACKEMKKHLCAYTKGLQGGPELRNKLARSEKTEQFVKILSSGAWNGQGNLCE